MKVSFGKLHQARIEVTKDLDWREFALKLAAVPPQSIDKASRGWYVPAEFSPEYRDSENFIARYALTFDFDHVGPEMWDTVAEAWSGLEYCAYTTASHLLHGPDKPRFRVVMPLSRPATYDEFQAVVRRVATDVGIENVARESFTPAQFMYLPTVRPGCEGEFRSHINDGDRLDVDDVLAEYDDWTDHTQWPHRKEGDGTHKAGEVGSPLDKPGIVGDMCRAFTIPQAIQRFELPYTPGSTEGRYTYTAGSRPDGMRLYDDETKAHSEHDTDPARGQCNAFDLVRLHKFADLDSEVDKLKPVTERPSYAAMCRLWLQQPEARLKLLEGFEALPPLAEGATPDFGPLTPAEASPAEPAKGLARRISDVLASPTSPDWLLEDVLERGVIAVKAGPRGSYKSFIVLDWAMRVAVEKNLPVYVVSAEGGDFDRRAAAWLQTFAPDKDPATVPLLVVERRLDLSSHDGVEAIRQDCLLLGVHPVLFILDTFSKLSGGLEENDNTEVKQFIGRLDNGLKRKETGFGATVVLVAHTGHSDGSRARGASALAADTDAEYIVKREADVVTVSRSRFKASPELPPLCYKPEVITLPREDKAGRAVTSLVMREADVPLANGKRKPKPGTVQRVVYDRLEEMSRIGAAHVDEEDLRDAVVKLLPRGSSERDMRKRDFDRALKSLAAAGLIFTHSLGRVALTAAQEATAEDLAGDPEFLQ